MGKLTEEQAAKAPRRTDVPHASSDPPKAPPRPPSEHEHLAEVHPDSAIEVEELAPEEETKSSR